ncbi:MAG: DNA primase [Candidatus Aenigmarchaeota archaeon]|nr:DNA primase [Candidatus Aenigmarchaeota archaeon]
MAKVSPVSIKYIIHAKFYATGTVEKPDVIGAVFGQTEGLLGEELELRELQKAGKIGRIDVEVESSEGKTEGMITIPTSIDQAETTIIAAALETIERIGPSDSKIQIEKIEDVRSSKREFIIERARRLLADIKTNSPESGEMENAVKVSARISQLQEYGTERLPAGNIDSDELIVVEGRADVVNLLKHGITNVIGMNGTVMPDAIKELSKDKEVTLFVDGDRGGELIAKNVIDNAEINYIAIAPAGTEVEELSGKEIITSLRKRVPINEIKEKFMRERRRGRLREKEEEPEQGEIKELTDEEKETFQNLFSDLIGTRGAYIIDKGLNILRKIPQSEVISALKFLKDKVYAIVIDGTAMPNLIKIAEKTSCKHIIARNFTSTSDKLNLVSL